MFIGWHVCVFFKARGDSNSKLKLPLLIIIFSRQQLLRSLRRKSVLGFCSSYRPSRAASFPCSLPDRGGSCRQRSDALSAVCHQVALPQIPLARRGAGLCLARERRNSDCASPRVYRTPARHLFPSQNTWFLNWLTLCFQF